MKIGIFGGTFDPPHVGHLIIAEHVRVEFGLDQVRFTPAWVPPHKQGLTLSSVDHRLAMLRLALEGNPSFAIDEREIGRQGVSYTVDTLRALKTDFPDAELFLLIGADNLADFPRWRDPDEIIRLANLVVMPRPGYSGQGEGVLPEGSYVVSDSPLVSISSTSVRHMSATGRSIRYLVPASVEDYIRSQRLYLDVTHPTQEQSA